LPASKVALRQMSRSGRKLLLRPPSNSLTSPDRKPGNTRGTTDHGAVLIKVSSRSVAVRAWTAGIVVRRALSYGVLSVQVVAGSTMPPTLPQPSAARHQERNTRTPPGHYPVRYVGISCSFLQPGEAGGAVTEGHDGERRLPGTDEHRLPGSVASHLRTSSCSVQVNRTEHDECAHLACVEYGSGSVPLTWDFGSGQERDDTQRA